MLDNLIIISLLLVAMAVAVGIYSLWRFLHLRVWLKVKFPHSHLLTPVGYLAYADDRQAAEVRTSGGGDRPIGRVVLDAEGRRAAVSILANSAEDDSNDGDYRERGFVAEDGTIYKYVGRRARPVAIGYTARPSAPLVPTIHGERRWYTLWLRKELNAYLGTPPVPVAPAPAEASPASEAQPAADSNSHSGGPVAGPDVLPLGDAKRIALLVAECGMTGLDFGHRGRVSSEARAAGFAALYSLFNNEKFVEFYNNEVYGWRDTALAATVVYSIIFMMVYYVNTCIFGLPLLGNNGAAVFILLAYYFLLWAIVRVVKIEMAEDQRSFQPRLDLLNKNLSLGAADIFISIFCICALYLTYEFYDYDFIPLILVVLLGVSINRTQRINKLPWKVQTSYRTENARAEELGPDEDPEPPHGDLSKTFSWDLDSASGAQLHGNLTLEFSTHLLGELRMANPYYSMRTDLLQADCVRQMIETLNASAEFSERIRYVAYYILREAKRAGLSELDTLQFALDFVQHPNVKFVPDKQSAPISYAVSYMRFPDETMYDQEGDSDCKSFLAALLFYWMGHNVLFISSRKYQHCAVCVEPHDASIVDNFRRNDILKSSLVSFNRRTYVYCETTDDGFRIGDRIDVGNPNGVSATDSGMLLDDFQTKVEICHETTNTSRRVVYEWDLDSPCGSVFHGEFAIDFDDDEVDNLRDLNPFLSYGKDGESFEQKISVMVEALNSDVSRLKRLDALAAYIRQSTAHLSELDTLQFALDFVQEPNIKYRIDEECESIACLREYVRFPDETLYDKEGDCDCKTMLAGMLFRRLGRKAVFLVSQKVGHAALGLELEPDWISTLAIDDQDRVVLERNGCRFIFCETTGDGSRIGAMGTDADIRNFDTIIDL